MYKTVISIEVNEKETKECEVKEIALNAFKNNFNMEVVVKDLFERITLNDLKGQKNYVVRWAKKECEYLNNNKGGTYIAVIDGRTKRILHLEVKYGEPPNQDYRNYSYDDGKNLATNFIKECNILGKNYTFLSDTSNAVNYFEDAWCYYFYFKYKENKKCLVTVHKGAKKISKFLLIDEINVRV